MSHMTVKASPRPARGTAAKAKRARRAAIEKAERAAKLKAKERDGWRCHNCGNREIVWNDTTYALNSRLEAAHIRSKGSGGDHGLRSSKASDYITLCHSCHQGPRSVHSGHLRIVAGPAGGDGPVRFERITPGIATRQRDE